MKKKWLWFLTLALATSTIGLAIHASSSISVEETHASSNYSGASLPTTIYLTDNSDSSIRSYYSALNGRNLNGDDLLAALKPILMNNQRYYGYSSGGDKIWQAYEITDRDWDLSPASDINECGGGTYNDATKTITGYKYGTSVSKPGVNNPYVHLLYRNRDESEGNIRAWDVHGTSGGVDGIDREHVWPKSRGFGDDDKPDYGARGDLHHLMAGDHYVNSTTHNNYSYGNVDRDKIDNDAGNSQTYIEGNYRGTSSTLGSGKVFEPQDDDKGDIARACFYMVARYNNIANDDDAIDAGNPNLSLDNTVDQTTVMSTSSSPVSIGLITDLLEWNRADPPSEYEIHRNNLIYNNFTYNRNPFIDFPSWADIIWGGASGHADPRVDCINDFDESGVLDETVPTAITLTTSSETLYEGETALVSVSSVTPENAVSTVTWTSSDTSIATVSSTGLITAVSEGSATITATSTASSSVKATVSVTVNSKAAPATDVLNVALIGALGNSYTSWTKTGSTGASYSGLTTGSSYVQMNSKSNYGIVSTVAGGKRIKTIEVSWNDSTGDGKTLSLYGKNTAYSSPADLYSGDSATQGTLLGEIVKGTSTSLTVDGDYTYIGIRAKDGAVYLNSISITYAKAVTSVSLDETSLSLAVDDTATLTEEVLPSNAEDKTVSWSSSNTDVATVSNGVVTAISIGEATITVTTTDGSKTATCDVTVSSSGGEDPDPVILEDVDYLTYKKVTDVSDLRDGDFIILVYETDNVAMSTVQNANNRGQADVSISSSTITLEEETTVQIITLERSGEYWALNVGESYLYAASSSSNYLRTLAELDNNGKWAISITNGAATLTAQGTNTRNLLKYNSGNDLFSCYASGQNDVSIYKSYEHEADVYGASFLTTYTAGCNNNGIGSVINWSSASSAYSGLTDSAKALFAEGVANTSGSSTAQALARYDYIVGKYGTSTYADFMGRDPSPLSPAVESTALKDNKNILALIIAIGLCGLSLTVFFVIRKAGPKAE